MVVPQCCLSVSIVIVRYFKVTNQNQNQKPKRTINNIKSRFFAETIIKIKANQKHFPKQNINFTNSRSLQIDQVKIQCLIMCKDKKRVNILVKQLHFFSCCFRLSCHFFGSEMFCSF